MHADRSQFFKDLSLPFYGYNRPGAKVSEGVRESFWLQGMMAGFTAAYFCIKAFSETDLTEDLKKFDVPTLILHGDDDQIVPIQASAMLSSKLVKGAKLKVYKGAPHGMCTTLKDESTPTSSRSSRGRRQSQAPGRPSVASSRLTGPSATAGAGPRRQPQEEEETSMSKNGNMIAVVAAASRIGSAAMTVTAAAILTASTLLAEPFEQTSPDALISALISVYGLIQASARTTPSARARRGVS